MKTYKIYRGIKCPECGLYTLEQSTYSDYCTNCDYSQGY